MPNLVKHLNIINLYAINVKTILRKEIAIITTAKG